MTVTAQPMGVSGTERSPEHPSVDAGEAWRNRVDMAEVEWEHERYFREKAASQWLWRVFPKWDPPPPKASIRAGVAELASAQ